MQNYMQVNACMSSSVDFADEDRRESPRRVLMEAARSSSAPVAHRRSSPGSLLVLTHNPPIDVLAWMTGAFIDEPIDAAVARAKDAAEGRSVGLLGPAASGVGLESSHVERSGGLTDLRFRVRK